MLLTSDAGLVGKSVRVPEEIVETTFSNENGYEGRSTVGVYEQKKFVVGVPMTDESGNVLGLVLAVMDGTALMEMSVTGLARALPWSSPSPTINSRNSSRHHRLS